MALVQQTTHTGAGNSNKSFAGATGANALLVWVAGIRANVSLATVTTSGLTWTKRAELSATSSRIEIWTAWDSAGGVARNVAWTGLGGGDTMDANLVEFDGFPDGVSVDVSDTFSNASGTAQRCSNAGITTTQLNTVIICGWEGASAINLSSRGDSVTSFTGVGRSANGYRIVTSSTVTLDGDMTFVQSEVGPGAIVALYNPATNSSPTLTVHTTSQGAVGSLTPSFEMTGADVDGDTLEYYGEITDNPDAFTGGESLEDNYGGSDGTGYTVHLNPVPSTYAWNGLPQIDDRMFQSFRGNGGRITGASFFFGAHETTPTDTNGSAYALIYALEQTSTNVSGTPLSGSWYKPQGAPDTVISGTPTPGWLAISDPLAFNPGASGQDWRKCTFSGGQVVQTVKGAWYGVALWWVPAGYATTPSTNTIACAARSGSGAAHAGNLWFDGPGNYGLYNNGGDDCWFRVYETYDLLSFNSTTGSDWINTVNGGDTHPFTAGERVRYTVPAELGLRSGVTYYARFYAIDPAGSNAASAWSSTITFLAGHPDARRLVVRPRPFAPGLPR